MLLSFKLNGVLEADPPALDSFFFWIYYQNNPFLGMFQLKLCPKTFENCLLLQASVLKSNILAIIFFQY